MRRVKRTALPANAQKYMDGRHARVIARLTSKSLDIEGEWKAARQTRAMASVVSTLGHMAGARQRCMYCVDSLGCDIEHFRPKARYPKHAFKWNNLLLCCTACGRLKGSRFPMAGRKALLVNPISENPWTHLDFDPSTGNLTARFNLQTNDWSAKGSETVDALGLDRREGLSAAYLKTLKRLDDKVDAAISTGSIVAASLMAQLRHEDDHGLLPWCFTTTGAKHAPFSTLKHQHPQVWAQCLRLLR